MTLNYLPILKGKQGELDALAKVTPDTRKSFTPLLEIPPIPAKYVDGEDDPVDSKSIDAHIDYTADQFARSLSGYARVYVDGFYVEEQPDLESGSEPTGELFKRLGSTVDIVPVTGLDRIVEYDSAVRKHIASNGSGCCIRLNAEDLDLSVKDLKASLNGVLSNLKLAKDSVDLLVDYGPKVPVKSGMLHQLNALPWVGDWRNLIVASSSFPQDMRDVGQDSIEEFDREEWKAWNYLRSNMDDVNRMPVYSDYGINHPLISEIDPRLMRLSPNIRYTSSLKYVVAKGRAYPRKKEKLNAKFLAGPSRKAADQYPKLSQMIVDHKAWCGKDFSWGDKFIEACSRRECVGNSSQWRSVGTSHHIAFVVQQLAKLRVTG